MKYLQTYNVYDAHGKILAVGLEWGKFIELHMQLTQKKLQSTHVMLSKTLFTPYFKHLKKIVLCNLHLTQKSNILKSMNASHEHLQ